MDMKLLRGLLPVLVSALFPCNSNGQTTAFTYQGWIKDGDAPAVGLYDLRFAIYDAPTLGSQAGPTLTNTALRVSNGFFIVSLDFGSGVFTGPKRWLEIAVRTNDSSLAFITLAPRQALTPSPYALYAPLAGTALTSATAASSYGFTGRLSGDVEGLQDATHVVAVGGETATGIASSVIATRNATAENVPDTIVKRNGSGNFSVADLTATGTLIAAGNVSVAGTVSATNGFLTPTFIGAVSYRTPEPGGVAEAYCSKAKIVSPNARQGVYDFVSGITKLGLLTNLADFALFATGQNTANGQLISWQNEAVTVGTVIRHRGGIEFPNYSGWNHIYFTNLPATPYGNTLVLWGSGYRGGGVRDANSLIYSALVEESAAGPLAWNPCILQYGFYAGNYGPYANNGISPYFGAAYYPRPGSSAAGFFCTSMGQNSNSYSFVFQQDYPSLNFGAIGSMSFTNWPTVLRLGMTSANGVTNGWWGLVRGFAYFNTLLSSNQVIAVNALMPRIGVIVSGDSKSYFPQLWWEYWADSPNNWGLMAIRTNAAVAGSMASDLNRSNFYTINYGDPWSGNSAEKVFPTLTGFQTNSTFPTMLYALRSGLNDLNATNAPNIVVNDFTAITNLWTSARTNGWKAVGWTIDRVRGSWTATGVFPQGASNALRQLNAFLRQHSANCDYFVDNEQWYVSHYGELPYLTSLYLDGVHDAGGSGPLGTNMLNEWVCPSFGYELPPQPGAQDLPPTSGLPNQILGSAGWTASPVVNAIGFSQVASPPSAYEIGGTPGSATNHLLRNVGGVMFDFWSDGTAVYSKQIAP